MKVLLTNGSPHKEGCTYTALCEVSEALNENGIDTDLFWIGKKPLSGCIACYSCSKNNKCVFDDTVNEFLDIAAIHTAIVVALVSGIFVMIFGQFIAKPVLSLMGTPDDVIDLAVVYLRIYLLGMPFIMLYDFGSSILRSTGDSRRPLYSLIVAGVINTVLNLVLVIGFKMGVSGVAIATVISNMVSSGIIVYIMTHESEPIRLEFRKLTIAPTELKKILVIGVPAGIQGMMFSIANVCIQSAINSFGSDAIAGSAASLNYEYFTYFLVNAFAQATVTFTSQNYGAGDYGRCKKIFHISMVFSLVSCGLLSMVFVLGRGMFLRFYTTDPAVLEYAMTRILICL